MSNDPRLACPFCAQLGHDVQSIALAPQHTGGDVDRAATWVPVCQDHLDGWFEDVPDDERLPVIPRDGIGLTVEQAEALAAARDLVKYAARHGYRGGLRPNQVPALDDAYEALDVALRALGRHDPDVDDEVTGYERN